MNMSQLKVEPIMVFRLPYMLLKEQGWQEGGLHAYADFAVSPHGKYG